MIRLNSLHPDSVCSSGLSEDSVYHKTHAICVQITNPDAQQSMKMVNIPANNHFSISAPSTKTECHAKLLD